ncbi:NAD(P)-binding domain-containing protein, partial [Leucobacter sp. M11]|uniref:NAD(P)-binding domain-containing protein n=1 Tax=Leucobacter sp. M11 TaxID=2993565 RepID=UPI002D7E3B33
MTAGGAAPTLPTVALLGGTGAQGRGLAFRFARAGITVRVGSRDPARARASAAELTELLRRAEPASSASVLGGE